MLGTLVLDFLDHYCYDYNHNGEMKQNVFHRILYILFYDNENKELKANGKDMLIVYKIREYINKAKGKERDVYLSNKFKLELLEQLKKEKSLSKLTPISLDKHLKLIYNISVNKQKRNIITSIKTNI